ncbi:TolC family protein [Chryseobacterium sp. MP_3.2]|uniref:TolC family protein n=1 Tax=Chryseobacterium sp. MP_3.2 TaxID=3071712 RepID=UPI002E03E22D|nr:outer membrane protein [Chryseobacterium sp. MP_3.2]
MKSFVVFLLCLLSVSLFSQKKWTLQESVNYAVENNLQVLRGNLNTKIQDNTLKIAKREYLPSVNANAGLNGAFGQGTDLFGNTNRNDNFRSNANVGADILLFNYGRLEKNIRKTQYEVEANNFDLQRTKDDISLQIAQQYLSILLNREIVQISESAQNNAQKLYERAKITTDVGTTPQTILAEAEAALAREKQNVNTAQINTDRSLFALAMLLQLKDYKNFDIVNVPVDNILDAPLFSAETIIDKAYENQPQIKAADSRIKSAEAQTEITRTAFWPTISANAGFGTSYFYRFKLVDPTGATIQQTNFIDQFTDNFGQQVGVSANIPIFNKGITRLQVEQSKINEELAKVALEQSKQDVLQNVQKAQFDAESNYGAYLAATQAEKSSRLAVDFAEKSFAAGRTTIYDLNTARNNFANAQGSVAQAKYNYLFSMKLLNFYAGIPLSL